MSSSTILPAIKYKEWIDNWQTAVEGPEPLSFFMSNGEPQTGAIFHFDSLKYLFSAPGIVTIKIRFGLHQSGDDSKQFHPILFGVNSRDEIITPYFISAAFTQDHYPEQVENEGNLPQELMRLWKKNWHENVLAGTVTQQMFTLNGGVLKGYNYARQDVMDAVGSFPGISDVHLKFGLHQYYSMQEAGDSAPAFAYTFGLILYASVRFEADSGTSHMTVASGVTPAAEFEVGQRVEKDSGFYDFTAPCPYTC